MAKNWDKYSRHGLDLAHTLSSFGFFAAKRTTRLGFSIARNIATTSVGLTTTAVDFTIFGGGTVTRPVFGLAVNTFLTIAEQITLAPIYLSEYITSTSLLAAHTSINILSVIFPGSSDASFSLASFIDLVRREWIHPGNEDLPETNYGITHIARAIVGWVSLQGVTQEWQEKRWLRSLKELDVQKSGPGHGCRPHRASRIRVTSDVIFPGQQGPQIIAADIGEREPGRSRASSFYSTRTKSYMSLHPIRDSSSTLDFAAVGNIEELKATLRRLSKMVLAGYGGASLLFFGVSPMGFGSQNPKNETTEFSLPDSSAIIREKTTEEAKLANAVDASEAEAAGDHIPIPSSSHDATNPYSWWDVLMGKHDTEIFERSTAHPMDHLQTPKSKTNKSKMKATAVVGREHLMPRFWVLTDHNRGQIVLIIRGTMSLNEIAVDLTCEAEEFQPASTPVLSEDDQAPIPGLYTFPTAKEKHRLNPIDLNSTTYHVHSGMLRLARAMGDVGKPVQLAVMEALQHNPDFELVLSGHSLGAGVAAILGMMWADPKTCLTVPCSGLPPGRRVSVYCFAPPALTDASLSRLTNRLIVSFVYSHDIVSRLSLGSVRDLRHVAMWLCKANEEGLNEGWSALTARAKRWKDGDGSPDDMKWFIAMRKTLEANMQNANMYPPGRILWGMRDADLHPSHRIQAAATERGGRLRLFEVLDVEIAFSQIIFASNMLTAHMPHQYDRVVHDLL